MEINKFILNNVEKIYEEMVNIRREIHQFPELGDEEFETSKKIKNFLSKNDIQFTEIINTGVVATIYNGDGNIVVTRADIDALPITEENTVEYKSKIQGKMHACGHDAHTTIQLGVAKILNENKDKWNGTVRFLFQPAEETTGGAKRMIENSALYFDKFPNKKPDAFFALHMAPEIELGKIGIKYNQMHACSAQVKIVIHGKSAHAALPHLGIDAILIGSKVVEYLQSIISRNLDPRDEAVITVGSFKGGEVSNIICDKVTMLATIRAMTLETRDFIKSIVENKLPQFVESLGGHCKVDISYGYDPVINNSNITKLVEENVISLFGENSLHIMQMARLDVEDVSYFLNEIPGCFFRLGTRNEDKNIIYDLHHPKFNIDENSLKYGMSLQLKNILSVLNNQKEKNE